MNLREDALKIWRAGVDAVRSDKLVQQHLRCRDDCIEICGRKWSVHDISRILIVGGGKAGAGMTRGALHALQPVQHSVDISGWVNVPEDCVEHTDFVTLHGARPAGINEPTVAGVAGTREILDRVRRLSPTDLCLVLLSGGGSALLPAPVPEITLEDKQNVTRLLARAGATIHELNTVRSQLSQAKGGGLLRNCSGGTMVTLIISDVIGDPLEIIASGPTVPTDATPFDALEVLRRYDSDNSTALNRVYDYLQSKNSAPSAGPTCEVENHIIGSNAIAVAAATSAAKDLGYEVISLGSENSGEAADHGRHLIERLQDIRADQARTAPVCVLAGGETTVRMADTHLARKGGRNQELVLAAVAAHAHPDDWKDIALLSGGTDGEDGPTDAAGAVADSGLVAGMKAKGLNPSDYLAINDSWTFFDACEGLIRTGPTHTNVMDLAVGIVAQK